MMDFPEQRIDLDNLGRLRLQSTLQQRSKKYLAEKGDWLICWRRCSLTKSPPPAKFVGKNAWHRTTSDYYSARRGLRGLLMENVGRQFVGLRLQAIPNGQSHRPRSRVVK